MFRCQIIFHLVLWERAGPRGCECDAGGRGPCSGRGHGSLSAFAPLTPFGCGTQRLCSGPAVYPDGRVCISILHAPGDDPMGYESSAERWSPVQSVEKILLSVVSMLAGEARPPGPSPRALPPGCASVRRLRECGSPPSPRGAPACAPACQLASQASPRPSGGPEPETMHPWVFTVCRPTGRSTPRGPVSPCPLHARGPAQGLAHRTSWGRAG